MRDIVIYIIYVHRARGGRDGEIGREGVEMMGTERYIGKREGVLNTNSGEGRGERRGGGDKGDMRERGDEGKRGQVVGGEMVEGEEGM